MILELSLVSSSSREGEATCDGRCLDEERVGSCVLGEDGSFAEKNGAYGEEGRKVMLQDVK